MDIREMKAGLKLNQLIATKIFGWIVWEEKRGEYLYIVFQKPNEREPYKNQQNWENIMGRYKQLDGIDQIDPMKHIICGLKNWSTDISAAMELLNKFYFNLENMGYSTKRYRVVLKMHRDSGEFYDVEVFGETIPLIVCRAALLAKEES